MVLIMMMMLMMMMMMGSIWEASHSWLLSSPQGLTHSIISSTALFAKKPMNSAIIMMIIVNTTSHVVLYTNQYLLKSLPSHFLFRKVIGILWKVKQHGWMTVFSIQYESIQCPCCLFLLVIRECYLNDITKIPIATYASIWLVIQKIESIWVWMIWGSKKNAL